MMRSHWYCYLVVKYRIDFYKITATNHQISLILALDTILIESTMGIKFHEMDWVWLLVIDEFVEEEVMGFIDGVLLF